MHASVFWLAVISVRRRRRSQCLARLASFSLASCVSSPQFKGSLAGGNCASYNGANGLQVSASGACNGDGTLTGTLFASLDCTGSTSETFTNVPMNSCSAEITLGDNGFFLEVSGC